MDNPVKDRAILQVHSAAIDNLNIALVSLSGNILSRHRIAIQKGLTQFSIPMPANAAAGNYVLQVSGKSIKATVRIIKTQ